VLPNQFKTSRLQAVGAWPAEDYFKKLPQSEPLTCDRAVGRATANRGTVRFAVSPPQG